jgi:thiamine biosynthesis lipoprotein
MSLVNRSNLHLKFQKRRAFLSRDGQSVDLGGIAKGYAADSILTKMRRDGITSAFTDFGGNVAVIGKKPDGRLWRVGIQHPRKENALLGIVSLSDQSIVTSGDYHQYFWGNGHKRYHHLIDPSTGYPSESGLISASIISSSFFEADALSTAVFLAGKEKGIRLLSHFPDAMAILVDSDLDLYISNRLQACFEPAEGIDIHLINEMKGNVSNES